MSFRYTNNLVGALKHRLMLEASHRELVRRQVKGNCCGVEVVCSGYGTVLAVRLVDKTTWAPFYRKAASPLGSANSDQDATTTSTTPTATGEQGITGPLDLDKLAESIKAAVWDATRKIRATKEEALHRSLSHNPQLRAQGRLGHWYEEDANSLRPLAFEALRHEAATPWMQCVQFGKRQKAKEILQRGAGGEKVDGSVADLAEGGSVEKESVGGACVTALDADDVDPSSIPFGSVHPLFVPALVQFENGSRSSLNENAIRQEQWRELSRDEQLFWERVELIRKGQIATIKSNCKRDYADEAAVADDNAEDKVQLRFTQ